MVMRWKMEERETGLRSIGALPRSHWLRDGGKRFACVSPIDSAGSAWYWVAGWRSGVPYENTCSRPVPTVEAAKAEAMAYVKEHCKRLSEEIK
jgi:hypothetical protein